MNFTDFLRDIGLLPTPPSMTPPEEMDRIGDAIVDHEQRISRLEARVEVTKTGAAQT